MNPAKDPFIGPILLFVFFGILLIKHVINLSGNAFFDFIDIIMEIRILLKVRFGGLDLPLQLKLLVTGNFACGLFNLACNLLFIIIKSIFSVIQNITSGRLSACFVLFLRLMNCYDFLLPFRRFTTTTMTAITIRIWINPPPVDVISPNSHKIKRITAIVHNINKHPSKELVFQENNVCISFFVPLLYHAG